MTSSDDAPDEGELICSVYGRIVRTSDGAAPYKAILVYNDRSETERSFATMREAEAFIRRNTPRPRSRSTSWDHRRS